MTVQEILHDTRLRAPYYQDASRTSLHRYLDADFVNRFQQDVQRRQFNLTQFENWQEEEKHSRWDRTPVLRLPTHRAFHLVCCEVVCERFGRPPLNPEKIASAGFVIRRLGGQGEQAWVLEDGEALGWQEAPTELRDPDLDRRLCANGVLAKRSATPAFSGEQTHPLHVLNTTDAKGKRHTLLYGYVPLGGFYYHRDGQPSFDTASQAEVEEYVASTLAWPFGFRDAGSRSWLGRYHTPVTEGRPDKAMFELLRLLTNRYHVGETDRPANAELEAICANLWFFDPGRVPSHKLRGRHESGFADTVVRYRTGNLAGYLQACFARADNPLVRWITTQEERIDQAGGLEHLSSLDRLPQADGSGSVAHSLFMTASDAEDLRHQLGQRYRQQTLAQAREIPLPKFGQGENDLYQIIPFVRFRNDQGKEQIQWADAEARSRIFRVAAPFDPEASRPSLIPMPSLRDLKRGLAKGASIMTPGDTFDMINNLNLKKGVGKDLIGDGPKPGIQWICSFSLPVITLVAMILLMIMIALLNIVFFWLPWVRICLPFPKINK